MALYAPVGGRAPTDQALPWCPVRLSPHAIPATPEGSPAPGSCAGSGDTGLPPNVHGVGAPNDVTRLRLGSLHATACGVACSPVGALVRELGASGYPSHLSRATRAHCQVPGPDFHRQVSRYPRHTDVALQVIFLCQHHRPDHHESAARRYLTYNATSPSL